MKKNILITKASGLTEPFSIKKLRRSLERTRAAKSEIDEVIKKLMPKLYHGISTKKIYSEAFRLIRAQSKPMAGRYQLKQGIMELGPSGFPFEKFIGKLFEAKGYAISIGQILNGVCVSHEIDVIGRKENEIVLVECKYRNSNAMNVDVKTPLYIHSRFEDVLANGTFKTATEKVKGWIATNSRFTSDAIAFANCKQINLLGWDYPAGNSLREIIDESGLYPVTCLSSLTKDEKQWLLSKDFVLAKDICLNKDVLTKAGLSAKRILLVAEEGKALCEMVSKTKT